MRHVEDYILPYKDILVGIEVFDKLTNEKAIILQILESSNALEVVLDNDHLDGIRRVSEIRKV